MKAVCVADIHGDFDSLVKLRNSILAEDFDYVILLGDYSRGFKDEKQNEADVNMVLDILSDFNVLAIPGNCDQKSVVEIFKRRKVNLHKTLLKLPEVNIIGFGGSNVTPFNTPFEYGEDEIRENLDMLYEGVDRGVKVVVIAHAPPKDTKCDALPNGLHVGSSGLRGFIESRKPDLVLCSHIHEAAGAEDVIGETRVLNVGRISEGRAYLLEVWGEISVGLYTG